MTNRQILLKNSRNLIRGFVIAIMLLVTVYDSVMAVNPPIAIAAGSHDINVTDGELETEPNSAAPDYTADEPEQITPEEKQAIGQEEDINMTVPIEDLDSGEADSETDELSHAETAADSDDSETQAPIGFISGVIWLDETPGGQLPTDGNGIRDPGEPAVPGFPVSLYAAGDSSAPVDTVFSGLDGSYTLEIYEPGGYMAGITDAPAGEREYTLPMAGLTNDNSFETGGDTEAYMAFSQPVEIVDGEAFVGVSAGLGISADMASDGHVIDLSGLTTGNITGDGFIYSSSDKTLTFSVDNGNAAGKTYTITQSVGKGAHNGNVESVIADGVAVTIEIDGVTIIHAVENKPPMDLRNNANLTLTLTGINKLTDNATNIISDETNAGIAVRTGVTLTINGGGSLSVKGGYESAGIGGSYGIVPGNININNGTITANGGDCGAGIGKGYGNSDGGAIAINGGTITATGGNGIEGAAGIGGGGWRSSGGTINITGGTVTATGGYGGAGIGGGADGAGGNITIAGTANVKAATGGGSPFDPLVGGAGIGGGMQAAGGTIHIQGSAIVSAKGMGGGAGIGGGYAGNSNLATGTGGTIVIGESANVTATGGPGGGAGIGGGGGVYSGAVYVNGAAGGSVTVLGTATVKAIGGYTAGAGIGGAGIGGGAGTTNGAAATLNLAGTATVYAFSASTVLPALHAAGNNGGNAYYVNARLNGTGTPISDDATLMAYSDANCATLTDTLTLPANYICFGFIAGTAPVTQSRWITAYKAANGPILGNIMAGTNLYVPNGRSTAVTAVTLSATISIDLADSDGTRSLTGLGYAYAGTTLTFSGTAAANKLYRVWQSNNTQQVASNIAVSGVTCGIILDGVNIKTTTQGAPPVSLTGTANLTLTLIGTNTLAKQCGTSVSGQSDAGISVPGGTTLTINGNGFLTVNGTTQSAGIGGGYSTTVGTINIFGGNVTVKGGFQAAGIGGGTCGACSVINIGGAAVINATAIMYGAGIGNGDGGSTGGTVAISGTADVTAYSSVSGIGSGAFSLGGGPVATLSIADTAKVMAFGRLNSAINANSITGGAYVVNAMFRDPVSSVGCFLKVFSDDQYTDQISAYTPYTISYPNYYNNYPAFAFTTGNGADKTKPKYIQAWDAAGTTLIDNVVVRGGGPAIPGSPPPPRHKLHALFPSEARTV